jgi:hypothetical protein
MLSENGNPELRSLEALPDVLGFRCVLTTRSSPLFAADFDLPAYSRPPSLDSVVSDRGITQAPRRRDARAL